LLLGFNLFLLLSGKLDCIDFLNGLLWLWVCDDCEILDLVAIFIEEIEFDQIV